MKRFITFLVAASMILSGFSAYAQRDIIFESKIENSRLSLPINENIIMKNGSVVLEFEDMSYDKCMAQVEDTDASGRKGLKPVGSTWQQTADALLVGPCMTAKMIVSEEATYNVWIRTRSTVSATYNSCFVDAGSTGTFNLNQLPYPEADSRFVWHKVATLKMVSGVNYVRIKYNQHTTVYDKMIVTSSSSFTPEGADASPFNKVEENTEVSTNLDVIPIFPKVGEHPRLYFKAEHIPAIKEQLKTPAFSKTYEKIQEYADIEIIGKLPETNTQYSSYGNYIDAFVSKAFLYALGEKDASVAKDTIKQLRDFITTVTFNMNDSTLGSQEVGGVLTTTACVYDWCYDQLTEEDKQFFVEKLPQIANSEASHIGYPPTRRGFLISQPTEQLIYRDHLCPAVALYDEFPEWFNVACTIIFEEILPFQHFQLQSNYHTSGSAYTNGRTNGIEYVDKIFSVLGNNDGIVTDGFLNLYYKWIYDRLSGGLWFKDGDDWHWNTYIANTRAVNQKKHFLYVGSYYKDPYLLYQGILDLERSGYDFSLPEFVMFIGQDINNKDIANVTDLPLTRFTDYPLTTMTARTSWQDGLNAPTAMVTVNMRELAVGDHQHRDIGAFQVYYKGMLALDSGLYVWTPHYDNYQSRSIAHNVMLVEDPNEPLYQGQYVVDGGQREIYNFGNKTDKYETVMEKIASGESITSEVKAKYAGPTTLAPKFSYISAEIGSAYSEKVEEYERSTVFINLKNEDYPAAFIVYDNLKSSDADFKKKWLLHSELEPEVNLETNTTTIIRTDNGQNGKLVNKTLIPAAGKTQIEKIGGEGKEFYVNGTNYPETVGANVQADMGAWRVEISPTLPSQEDRFLNAMYVCDADRDLPELPMYREYGSVYSGVTVMDNMVTFSNTRTNLEDSFTVNVRDNGYNEVSVLLTDIKEGVWKVSGNGIEKYIESKVGENCLAFGAAPGRYSISPASSNSKLTDEYMYASDEPEDFGDFIIRKDKNHMYLPKPTKLIDSVPYVAVDGIFTQFGVKILSKGENSITLGNDVDTLVLTADSNICVLNGEEITVANAPKMVKGEMYANMAEYTKFLSIKDVNYDDFAKVLSFKAVSKTPIEGVDMTKVVTPVNFQSSIHDGENSIDLICDRNLESYFCSVGDNAWAEYDLGEVYDISKVMLAFFRGSTRKTLFEIQISEDGVNYTTVFDGTSNGKTEGLQTFRINERARFIKVVCHGNDNGVMYNSIYEMLVLKD